MTVLNLCPNDMAAAGFTCIDKFEAPNIDGMNPMIMQSAEDGVAWCQARGKRLCRSREWETACEASKEPCNNDKSWRPWDRKTVSGRSEIARLWQGSASGEYKECRTPSGVFDLQGNVEEWVETGDGEWPYALKGGWWAKVTACHKTNDAHPPNFRFYETGFRCCL